MLLHRLRHSLLLHGLGLCVCFGSARAQDEPAAADPAPAPARVAVARQVFAAQQKFDRPLLVAFDATAPDTAFVVEQPGRILAVPRDDAQKEWQVFADLRAKVYSGDNWEEGLLGFTFDPQYAGNGFVYVCFTEKTPQRAVELRPGHTLKSTRQSVIARYATKVDGDGHRVLDDTSELRVLTVFQPFANHNGGTIVFGPDHMLYAAFGDGGAQRDPFKTAQDKGVLLGKVLRIDVRNATAEHPYAIPPDNPFVGQDGARGEVWCYGMRNPWRIAFDRATGDLWCGDVGQDRIEEVDRLQKGGNYGWSLMEGTEVFRTGTPLPADLIPPVAEYQHKEGVSVTGGHVYRGKALAGLQGSYVYGDFSTFRIWAVAVVASGKATVREIGRAPAQLSSFAEEPDGELLVTCFDGKVYRLVPAPAGG
jgi:glucose/arabinose dehydrogenase